MLQLFRVFKEVKITTITHIHNRHVANILNLICLKAEGNAQKESVYYSNSFTDPDMYVYTFKKSYAMQTQVCKKRYWIIFQPWSLHFSSVSALFPNKTLHKRSIFIRLYVFTYRYVNVSKIQAISISHNVKLFFKASIM